MLILRGNQIDITSGPMFDSVKTFADSPLQKILTHRQKLIFMYLKRFKLHFYLIYIEDITVNIK